MCVCVHACCCVQLFVTSRTAARQAPLSIGFPREEYCSKLSFPPPRDPPDPGVEPTSLASPALAGGFLPLYPLRSPHTEQNFEVTQSLSDSATPWTARPTRLLCPLDFPGKGIGAGCHFLLQGNLPDPGIEPRSPALHTDTLLTN